MNFNVHSHLEGQHAFLSASKYHWINYDEEKLAATYRKARAAQLGTEYHEVACKLIRLGIKLPKSGKTLNRYVNDAIGFQMQPEVLLYYSDNCFGTADTISFKKNVLRISDYKSGESSASIKQLCVYAALFCLEYGYKPMELEIELRLYQYDDVTFYIPTAEEILYIMAKIISFDKQIEKMKIGG